MFKVYSTAGFNSKELQKQTFELPGRSNATIASKTIKMGLRTKT